MHTRIAFEADLGGQVLDAIPEAVLVVDEALRILAFNHAAEVYLDPPYGKTLRQLCGHALRCLNEQGSDRPCGETAHCDSCALREAVETSRENGRTFRRRYEFQRESADGEVETLHLLVTAAPLESGSEILTVLVLEDVSAVTRLHQLLPICAGCKKVRDDQDRWHELAVYVSAHSDVLFSHGYCQECAERAIRQTESHPTSRKPRGGR
jgi:nitrogen-specific signal transduction histidine kinase